jgi:hypothetical protein
VIYAGNLVMDMSSQALNNDQAVFHATWRTWKINDQ